MYKISLDGVRIGTITRFAGNKPTERWVAYSVHRGPRDAENSRRFSSRKAATDWLVSEEHRATAEVGS